MSRPSPASTDVLLVSKPRRYVRTGDTLYRMYHIGSQASVVSEGPTKLAVPLVLALCLGERTFATMGPQSLGFYSPGYDGGVRFLQELASPSCRPRCPSAFRTVLEE